jgi:hypothetical protein
MTYIDAVLNQLLSDAIDHVRDGQYVEAIEAIIAARERAEAWGATVEPIREDR